MTSLQVSLISQNLSKISTKSKLFIKEEENLPEMNETKSSNEMAHGSR
jgi:hypothetical protein